jgi:hypothetical protein
MVFSFGMFHAGVLIPLVLIQLQAVKEEGLLNLKDKVRDLVPEIEFVNPWEASAPILVEHLLYLDLNHLSSSNILNHTY